MANKGVKLTPMMEQWHKAKAQHPDAILLFRMGDFYELFGQDAITAAPLLNLTLTSRDKEKSGLKMAGFPFHAAESYIVKLIEQGQKVAICEQLEDPKLSRGVVRRGITNVITPGTALDTDAINLGEFSFLLSLACHQSDMALCALDLATATFNVTSSTTVDNIIQEALRIAPKELIISRDDERALELGERLAKELRQKKPLRIESREAFKQNTRDLRTISLGEAEQKASHLVLNYLAELKGNLPTHLDCPRKYSIDAQLLLDAPTRVNLDLLPEKKGERHNLFSILDDAKTVMGRRALYQTIKAPPTDMAEIEFRHNIVDELSRLEKIRGLIRDVLARCYDVEKLTALLASMRISPRGLAQLRDSLISAQEIFSLIRMSPADHVKGLLHEVPYLDELVRELAQALVEEPPLNLRDGGVFKEGYDKELDELRSLVESGRVRLLALEDKERRESGIPSLKVKFTRVFGYYIEITRTHLEKVPEHYRRKQTVANGERYVTEELSELELKMNNAEANALALEERRFLEFTKNLSISAPWLVGLGRLIAMLDMLSCFAELAKVRNLARPKMLEAKEGTVNIVQGRHPIVEENMSKDGAYFVPNDVVLDRKGCSLMLITGPNMAGKSTIMRQVALIQIMAQIGSFVPAREATLSICDAIFARVGASDDLSTGRSTFMVEMTETASILKNATANSLILLDEIGRGTSTYDGLSIAQAVAEYIHDELKTRTLFATHYHELTKLQKHLRGFRNFHVEIEDGGSEIRFLYSLKSGPCLKSFGIHVAKLAGLPGTVLARAHQVLSTLEDGVAPASVIGKDPHSQLDLFCQERKTTESKELMEIIDKIIHIDVGRITPLQALTKLAAWQTILRSRFADRESTTGSHPRM
ncbi:MAG TPA: DNA mismatch repair protein MutS [Myxococcota bacterium]|nr:DNA mismatch repair protein MutS [Myxococcota bacterium]